MTATELFGNFSVASDNSMLRVLPSNLLREEALTFYSVTDMTAKTVCVTFLSPHQGWMIFKWNPENKQKQKAPPTPFHPQKSFSPDSQ